MVIIIGDRVLRSKFVNRKKELLELKREVKRLIDGKGKLVFIEGEAGVGKTRLIEELQSWVMETKKEVQFLAGKCIFREGSDPYLPFTDALKEYHERSSKTEFPNVLLGDKHPELLPIEMIPLLEPSGTEPGYDSKSGLSEKMIGEDQSEGKGGADLPEDAGAFKNYPPIGFIPSVIKTTNGETLKLAQDKMFESISDQLIDLSKKGPVILFLDDLQWADNATLNLLHYITEKTRDSPILIYGVYRPEELQLSEDTSQPHPLADTIRRLSRDKLFNNIKLKRLSHKATENMTKLIFNRDDIPKGLSKWLYKMTEGNPFFIEEVVISLIEEDIIDPNSYLWPTELDLKKLSQIKVPTTIEDLIIRRLNRLEVIDLKILSIAALIGREFDYNVLTRITQLEEEKLLDSLDVLINTGLIHEDFSSNDKERYKFDNVMIQDIAYDGLSRVRKRLLHKRVGEIIEKLNLDRINAVIYELAHHYYRGKVWNKAVFYLVKAAEKASNLYALTEAVEYYKLVLEGLAKLEDSLYYRQLRIGILENLGHISQVLGEWDDALDYYEEELRIVKKVDDFIKSSKYIPERHGEIEIKWLGLKQAEAYMNIADINRRKSNWQLSEKNYRDGMKLSTELEDYNGLAEAHRGLGYMHWRRGEHEKAISHYDKGIKFGKKLKDRSIVSIVFIELGNIYNYQGDWERAIKFYNRSIQNLKKLDIQHSHHQRLRQEMARAYNNLGDIHIKKQAWDKAIDYFEKSEKIAKEIGDAHMRAWSIFNAGECYAKKHELEQATDNCQKALKLLGKDDKIGIAATYKILGIINRLEKNWNVSNKYFQNSIKMFKNLNVPYDLAITNYECGLMFKDKGDKTSSKRHFQNAHKIFEKLDATKEMKDVNKQL